MMALLLALLAAPQADPSWAREAVFYHVYVRSFADSDGDGHGDLDGLAAKLDYIASLGVDGLLLLPVFRNDHDEYGGYATTDFFRIEDDYGGDAAWDRFVRAARERNLKIALDLSLTHVSDAHPWFAAARKGGPERARFLWAGPPAPGGKNLFGGPAWNPLDGGPAYHSSYGATVPSLNLRDPATAREMIRVGAHWLGRGADGFRLDSAPRAAPVDPARPAEDDPSSPATHAFWREFMAEMKRVKPSSFAVAEVFDGNPARLAAFTADGIDMAFDFPVFFGLADAWTTGKKANLANLIRATLAARTPGAMGGAFLGNHDVPGTFIPPHGRTADLLGGDLARLQTAAVLLFSLPSTPFVYYGEEIGLRGAAPAPGRKAWSRNPMPWDDTPGRGFTAGKPWTPFAAGPANVAAQDGKPGALLETYRGLIKVRRSSPALAKGACREVPCGDEAVLCFLRSDPAERVLVAVNFAGRDVEAAVNLKAAGIAEAKASDRIFGIPFPDVAPANAAAYRVKLPAGRGLWLLLK